MLLCSNLCPLSFCNHLAGKERALILLYSECHVTFIVLWLSLVVRLVGMYSMWLWNCLVFFLLLFRSYPILMSRHSGVVLDCIDSWSLPPFLLRCSQQSFCLIWTPIIKKRKKEFKLKNIWPWTFTPRLFPHYMPTHYMHSLCQLLTPFNQNERGNRFLKILGIFDLEISLRQYLYCELFVIIYTFRQAFYPLFINWKRRSHTSQTTDLQSWEYFTMTVGSNIMLTIWIV